MKTLLSASLTAGDKNNYVYEQTLFLQEIVDDLMAVLAEVFKHKADVYPVRTLRVVLHNQLVKRQMIFDVVKPSSALLQVTVYAKVSSLPLHVLRVVNTAHGFVQFLTAKAASNLYRLVHRHSQRFQHVGSQVHQIDDLLNVRLIINSKPLRRCAGVKFFDCEVHGDRCIHTIRK